MIKWKQYTTYISVIICFKVHVQMMSSDILGWSLSGETSICNVGFYCSLHGCISLYTNLVRPPTILQANTLKKEGGSENWEWGSKGWKLHVAIFFLNAYLVCKIDNFQHNTVYDSKTNNIKNNFTMSSFKWFFIV